MVTFHSPCREVAPGQETIEKCVERLHCGIVVASGMTPHFELSAKELPAHHLFWCGCGYRKQKLLEGGELGFYVLQIGCFCTVSARFDYGTVAETFGAYEQRCVDARLNSPPDSEPQNNL